MHSNTGWTKTKKSSYEPMEFVSAEFVKRLLTTKLSLGGGGGGGVWRWFWLICSVFIEILHGGKIIGTQVNVFEAAFF